MTGSLEWLAIAVAAFVGGHFVLSSVSVRGRLVRIFGEGSFLILYSAVAAVALIWMITAYGAAPRVPVWSPPAWTAWIPLVVMPVALLFLVGGYGVANPMAVGGEARAREPKPMRGMLTVTRHPILWGIALWAGSHLLANGTAPDLLLFGGILVLCLGGMAAIDHKRRLRLGSAWGPIALATSVVPFVAIAEGRQRLDWQGIGPVPPMLALVLYAILLLGHPWLTGTAVPIP